MEVIKKISQKIDSELEDAEKYIKCAFHNREEYPQLADTYYRLSLEEMNHVTLLHEQVVKIIDSIKRETEVPESMMIVYNYLHERQIKWAAKIKAKQDSFKG